jgi:hypothetical protein
VDKFRERGIYKLLDGEEFVVNTALNSVHFLYTLAAWEYYGMHAYELDDAGDVRMDGKPTYWRSEDLTDTGRTAHSRIKRGVA